jgi:hypothetical protein
MRFASCTAVLPDRTGVAVINTMRLFAAL